MTFREEIKDSYIKVDDYNMLVTSDPKSRGDSVGRTVLGWIAWGWKGFAKGLNLCWGTVPEDGSWRATYRRHPLEPEGTDFSRDHLSYLALFYTLSGKKLYLKSLVHFTGWRISERYTMTPDLWLWLRAIYGSHLAGTLFYLVTIPMMTGVALWNNLLCLLAGFREQDQAHFKAKSPDELSKFELWARKRMYPAYALHNLSWQLFVMRNSILKRVAQRVTSLSVGRTNYLVQMLLGKKVPKKKIDSYVPMNGYRWSTRLDNTNDRDIKVLDGEKYNLLDLDLLNIVYLITGGKE